jgi:hypothetical protein
MDEVIWPPVLVRHVVVRTTFEMLTLVLVHVATKPPLAARSTLVVTTGAPREPKTQRLNTMEERRVVFMWVE